MEKMIAYCGLICSDCPLYSATRSNDEERAREIVELLKTEYGIDASVADIPCDGCTAGKRLFVNCAQCEIRPCAIGRGIATCGRCTDFPCEKIEAFLHVEPAARDVLLGERQKKRPASE